MKRGREREENSNEEEWTERSVVVGRGSKTARRQDLVSNQFSSTIGKQSRHDEKWMESLPKKSKHSREKKSKHSHHHHRHHHKHRK